MKKIALTSLLTVFAVSGAHAANVIDGNPLYMPKKGHFYSVTSLESHSEHESAWSLGENFGYGVSDKLALEVSTSATENHEFDYMAWNDLSLKATFRVLDKGVWKLDVIGSYGLDAVEFAGNKLGGVWPDHRPFMDKDDTVYAWAAGVRGGYTTSKWTVAGKALFQYWNTSSFKWNADKGAQGVHTLILGVDAQYVVDNNWNLVAGAQYTGVLDDEYRGNPLTKVRNAGVWHGEFGVNYNIDATKFVGAYISGDMNHHGGAKQDEWKTEDGFGFGAKFGIDF